MNNSKFYPSDALAFGLKTALNNLRFLVLSTLAFWGGIIGSFLIVCIPCLALIQYVNNTTYFIQSWSIFDCLQFQKDMHSFDFYTRLIVFFAFITYLFITYALFAGYCRMILKFYDTGSMSVIDIFKAWDKSFPMFMLSMLYALIVTCGLMFFIIPGIYWAMRFIFSFFILSEKNIGIIDALKESYTITKGQEWNILALYIIVPLFGVFPSLTIMISFPLLLVFVFAYKHCLQ